MSESVEVYGMYASMVTRDWLETPTPTPHLGLLANVMACARSAADGREVEVDRPLRILGATHIYRRLGNGGDGERFVSPMTDQERLAHSQLLRLKLEARKPKPLPFGHHCDDESIWGPE